jgi:two-component system CheB/CheR fusion protein
MLHVAREGDVYEIRVKDNGIGIPPDMLARIFDLFVQAERPPGQLQDGFGVGLSLARVIAQHHGGMIQALSAGSGKGSEFIVRLAAANPA